MSVELGRIKDIIVANCDSKYRVLNRKVVVEMLGKLLNGQINATKQSLTDTRIAFVVKSVRQTSKEKCDVPVVELCTKLIKKWRTVAELNGQSTASPNLTGSGTQSESKVRKTLPLKLVADTVNGDNRSTASSTSPSLPKARSPRQKSTQELFHRLGAEQLSIDEPTSTSESRTGGISMVLPLTELPTKRKRVPEQDDGSSFVLKRFMNSVQPDSPQPLSPLPPSTPVKLVLTLSNPDPAPELSTGVVKSTQESVDEVNPFQQSNQANTDAIPDAELDFEEFEKKDYSELLTNEDVLCLLAARLEKSSTECPNIKTKASDDAKVPLTETSLESVVSGQTTVDEAAILENAIIVLPYTDPD